MGALVLGASGFIGSHLVHHLLDKGDTVRIYSRRQITSFPAEVEIRVGELLDTKLLMEAMKGQEVVFYLSWSGYPSTQDQAEVGLQTNVLNGLSIIKCSIEASVKRLIFTSSGGTVYGKPNLLPISEDHPTQPIGLHGLEKLIVEKYLDLYRRQGKLDSIVLRLGNVYGPNQIPERGQGIVSTAMGRLHQQKPIEVWGDGQTVRDYVFVKDAVRAIAQATSYPLTKYKIFNLSSGHGISVNDLLDLIEDIAGLQMERIQIPALSYQVPVNVLDPGLIKQEIGWSSRISLTEGLKTTWEWIQTS